RGRGVSAQDGAQGRARNDEAASIPVELKPLRARSLLGRQRRLQVAKLLGGHVKMNAPQMDFACMQDWRIGRSVRGVLHRGDHSARSSSAPLSRYTFLLVGGACVAISKHSIRRTFMRSDLNIAVLPGDGIGIEVTDVCLSVLDKLMGSMGLQAR